MIRLSIALSLIAALVLVPGIPPAEGAPDGGAYAGTNPPPSTPPAVDPSTLPMNNNGFVRQMVIDAILQSALGLDFMDKSNVLSNPKGASSAWPRGSRAPRRGPGKGWAFLPGVPFDVMTLATSHCVQQYYSPYVTPEFMAAAYLVEIGEPSLLGMESVKGFSNVSALIEYVERCVRPLPRGGVAVPGSPRSEDLMLQRLVLEDLGAGYAHSAGTPLARRILADRSLAMMLLPRLARAAEHAHPLIRRNAVHLIASLAASPEAEAHLCRILESTEDSVCRYRAVRGLMARPSTNAGAALLKQYESSTDKRLRLYVLYALAFADPGKGLPAAVDLLRDRTRDHEEEVWAALQVLARAPSLGAEALQELRSLESKLKREEGPSRPATLPPTSPTYRIAALRRMAWCALARSGAAEFADLIRRAVKSHPKRRSLNDFPDISAYLAIDLMARIHRPGLLTVAEDPLEKPELRARAIEQMGKVQGPERDSLASLSTSSKTPYLVRTAALSVLAGSDSAAAQTSARRFLNAYAEGTTPKDDPSAEWSVIAAVRILAEERALKADVLLKAFERAVRERALRAREVARAEKVAAKAYVPPRRVPFVPLAESLLSAMATERSAASAAKLIAVMRSGSPEFGGEAALALGESEIPGIRSELFQGLKSRNAWVRFCCSYALGRLTGKSVPRDWIYSTAPQRRSGVKEWKRILDAP